MNDDGDVLAFARPLFIWQGDKSFALSPINPPWQSKPQSLQIRLPKLKLAMRTIGHSVSNLIEMNRFVHVLLTWCSVSRVRSFQSKCILNKFPCQKNLRVSRGSAPACHSPTSAATLTC